MPDTRATDREGLAIENGVLSIDGRELGTRLRVIDAVRADGRLVVLYDPDANPRTWGTFPNLAAIEESGKEVWVAETATTTSGDHYYRIASASPLRVAAPSYLCTIDTATGVVLDRQFLK